MNIATKRNLSEMKGRLLFGTILKKKVNATELKVSCTLTHFLFAILVNVVKTPLSVSKNGPKALGTCTKAIKFRRNIRHHRHRH